MQSGLEGALIKMKTLLSAPGMDESEPNINADIYGNWYGNRGRGNVVVSFTAYLGERWLNKDLTSLTKVVKKFTPTASLPTFRLMVKPITKI